MNFKLCSVTILWVLFFTTDIPAQTKKFDTTVKMGDQGFRVECSNKNSDKNDVSVSPVNLKATGQDPTFRILGRVTKALTDDFNDDGRPDLVVCVYSGDDHQLGSVVGLSYTADKSYEGIYFPDIYLDAKIREGYKGHDEFSTLTGTLLRKFPVYLPTDAADKPTGGIRTIQYKAMTDNGRLSFKVLRWFDVKS